MRSSYLEGRDMKITVPGHSRQKVLETPSQRTSWVWWFMAISSRWEAEVRGLCSKAGWGKIIRPYLKNS
jgi:hypothetical protein